MMPTTITQFNDSQLPSPQEKLKIGLIIILLSLFASTSPQQLSA